MSLFYNDTCVTKKFIRNCDRVFFPCKLSSNDNLALLNIFNFFSQLPGLTDLCFSTFIDTLTNSHLENQSEMVKFVQSKIRDIYGALSCGSDKIVTDVANATEKTEVVVINQNTNLEPIITHVNHYFVLQSVLSFDGGQEAIDYKTYKNNKTGVGIYGKITPKDKQTFTTSDNAEEISKKTTGPKPLSISSLAIKHRRSLICTLLRRGGGGGATGSGSGSGGSGGSGSGLGSGGSGLGSGGFGSGLGSGTSDGDGGSGGGGTGGGAGAVDSNKFINNIKGICNDNPNSTIYFYIDEKNELAYHIKGTEPGFTSTNNIYEQFKITNISYTTTDVRRIFIIIFNNKLYGKTYYKDLTDKKVKKVTVGFDSLSDEQFLQDLKSDVTYLVLIDDINSS
jgi:hypothetical protein